MVTNSVVSYITCLVNKNIFKGKSAILEKFKNRLGKLVESMVVFPSMF
jgi:hypothetical protein